MQTLRGKLFLSGMDENAAALARKWGLGLELTDFCEARKLEEPAAMEAARARCSGIGSLWLHAPFAELSPCAIDPRVREVVMLRFRQTVQAALSLGIRRIVVHSGYIPLVYFPEWFIARSVEFWREFLRDAPDGLCLALENVMEPGPDMLVQIAAGVDDPRFGLCLDVGHANTRVSETPPLDWIAPMAPWLRHVHLHNNDGDWDLHDALGQGMIPMPDILAVLAELSPAADYTIENQNCELAALALRAGLSGGTMTEQKFQTFLRSIRPADRAAMDAAARRQAELAKPPGSLGALEDVSIRLAGLTGRVKNRIDRCRVLVFAADNGVTAEGVSATPVSVTLSQSINMTRHITGMSALAAAFGDSVVVTDVGIDADVRCPEIVDRKIRRSTGDIAREPAMTREQALTAISVGMEQAQRAAQDGMQAVGIGEMGIGNTTTSAAVLAALTGLAPEELTGRGAGLTDDAFRKKKDVIRRALTLHRPDPADPVGVLSAVGGLDLAAMTGAFLGLAAAHVPAVADGLISVVAALCAVRLCPAARDAIFLSHASKEPGYRRAAEELGLAPFLQLGMRLGEGSGCPLAFQVLKAACAVMNGMATFAEAAINDDYLESIRTPDAFQLDTP